MSNMIDRSGRARRSPDKPAYQLTQPTNLVQAIAAALSRPEHRERAVAGRVVLPEDGRPIRSVITGRRTQVTGSYASRKAGRAQVFESMTERAFFMHCEVDVRVVDYRAQPFRFEFLLGGRWRTYIADCVRLMDDGRIEVIELKSDLRDLRDLDYQAKLERVRGLCGLLGWRFSIVRRRHLEASVVHQRNIELVQQDRLTSFDDRHVYRVTDALAEDATPLGEVAEATEVPQVGVAIIKAMMVARIVEIDLGRPLTEDSPVRLLQTQGRA